MQVALARSQVRLEGNSVLRAGGNATCLGSYIPDLPLPPPLL